MDVSHIIEHMDRHHVKDMELLLEKFGQIKGASHVHLKDADLRGIEIAYMLHGKEDLLRIDFPVRLISMDDIKGAIIDLCMSVPQNVDLVAVRKELEEFRNSLSSVCIASLSPENKVVCSYSPLIPFEEKGHIQFCIYVSEVAEHFHSIKAHPENLEIMFLEDEAVAKSPILRRRLRYKAHARFVDRGLEFDRIYDGFLSKHGKGRGLETIRDMQDFHLIKLDLLQGRFVKGFGQAYDIDLHGNLVHVGVQGMPHSMPHGVKKRPVMEEVSPSRKPSNLPNKGDKHDPLVH